MSIEDLFKCQKFCANLKHSERLNSGVMVVEPSETVFNDMMTKWMIDDEELRVIHYTFGPLKPWDWWTSWVVNQLMFGRMSEFSLKQISQEPVMDKNPKDEIVFKFLILLPAVFLVFCYYRSFLQFPDDIFSQVPFFLGAMSIVCFVTGVLSLALSLSIVTRQIIPWMGLFLVYVWTFTIFFILFGSYLHIIYQWGKCVSNRAASVSSGPESFDFDSGKGHLKQMPSCDGAAWYYVFGMTSLALAAPLLPSLLGITALFSRLGLMVAVAIIFVTFATHASEIFQYEYS